MQKPAKNTICLWYDGDAEDAARFYAETFPDSSVEATNPHHGKLDQKAAPNRSSDASSGSVKTYPVATARGTD